MHAWSPRKCNIALATSILFKMPPKWCFLNCWTPSKSAFNYKVIMGLKAICGLHRHSSHFILLYSLAIPLVVDWSIKVLILQASLNAHLLVMLFNISSVSTLGHMPCFGQKTVANMRQDLKSACTLGFALFPLLESWVWQAWTSLLDDTRHVVQLSYQPRWWQANLYTWMWPHYNTQTKKTSICLLTAHLWVRPAQTS